MQIRMSVGAKHTLTLTPPTPRCTQVVALGIQGFQLNNTELRECTHGMFACIAKVRPSSLLLRALGRMGRGG